MNLQVFFKFVFLSVCACCSINTTNRAKSTVTKFFKKENADYLEHSYNIWHIEVYSYIRERDKSVDAWNNCKLIKCFLFSPPG